MTVQECYERMDGDYTGVRDRLIKEERIEKYLRKFLASTDYQDMQEALAKGDYETAFRASHTMKGLSMNLGFTGLQKSSGVLCEALRGGKPEGSIDDMLQAVEQDYIKVIGAIKML